MEFSHLLNLNKEHSVQKIPSARARRCNRSKRCDVWSRVRKEVDGEGSLRAPCGLLGAEDALSILCKSHANLPVKAS